MDKNLENTSYYAASTAVSPAVGTRSAGVAQTRAQLNKEQVFSSNALFVIAVMLYVFIVIWYTDLSSFGFYSIVAINALLFMTIFCTWMNASKWFHVPAVFKRRTSTATSSMNGPLRNE